MTQERRRYGFVLERQCSLAKHYASFHEVALAALHPSVDKWREVAATREYLPQSVEDMFASRLRVNLRHRTHRAKAFPRDFTRDSHCFVTTIKIHLRDSPFTHTVLFNTVCRDTNHQAITYTGSRISCQVKWARWNFDDKNLLLFIEKKSVICGYRRLTPIPKQKKKQQCFSFREQRAQPIFQIRL